MQYKDLPAIYLLRLMATHGIDASQAKNVLTWLLKASITEPFRLIEMGMYDRKIKSHHVYQDPIFILGYYRSGTTYLQRLFAHDDRLGYQTVFETAFPELMLSMEKFLLPLLQGVAKVFQPKNKFQRVPLNWNQPGEEDVAFVSLGWPETVNWGHFFPSAFEQYVSEYTAMDLMEAPADRWKKKHNYWVKKLSLKKGRQLVLKNPPNSARIPLLLDLYPDARFVFIHRDPFDVYASNLYLWKLIAESYSFQKLTKERIASLILWSYKQMMQTYLQTRDQIPAGNLVEISFESLVKDPIAGLQEIYDALNLPDFEPVEQCFAQSQLLATPYHQTRHRLSDEEIKAVETQWEPIYSRLRVSAFKS